MSYHLYGLMARWAILLALTISDKLRWENETAAELFCLRQNCPYFSWFPYKWLILCRAEIQRRMWITHKAISTLKRISHQSFCIVLLWLKVFWGLCVKNDYVYFRLTPWPRNCNLVTNCTLMVVSCHRQMHEGAFKCTGHTCILLFWENLPSKVM